MKFPKQLDPHPLRDTYVQIRYSTLNNISFELLKGVFFQKLRGRYKFQNDWDDRFDQLNLPSILSFAPDYSRLRFSTTEPNPKTVQFGSGFILFNAGKAYDGWDTYLDFIREVLQVVLTLEEVESFDWAGLRYISEFPETSILDKLQEEFCYFSDDFKYKNTTFRTEYSEDKKHVVLNLANNLVPTETAAAKFYSLTDIDVSMGFVPTRSLVEVVETLRELHALEKEIFFGRLLKPSFIDTLNPEY